MTEKVMLLGFRNDIPALMSASDAFVLSSLWEGFGMVIVEAMFCSLPVVSTECDGPKEIISDGKSGYLVPIKDSASLGEAMRKVQSFDITTRKKMGEAGRKHALENYDIEKILDLWEVVYSPRTA